jgi:hypothetical protein
VLQQLGLARRADDDAWDVKSDFDAVLRGMQKLSDRQRMIAAYGSLLSNPMLPVRYTPTTEISELTGRVIGHAQDDRTDRPAMILEGADGFVHLIPHDQAIETYRAKGRLVGGDIVTLKRIDGRLIAQSSSQNTPNPPETAVRFPVRRGSDARRSR